MVIGDSLQPKTWGSCWDYHGKRLVELVNLRKGSRVLDIGTGGGASLYPAARKVGSEGQVIGIEICEGCFKHTSSEIERCGIANAKMFFMDARKMEFEDESFDCVLSGFVGWDDYYDFDREQFIKPDRIMMGILRVLKESGLVGVSGWAVHDQTRIMKDLLLEYLPSDSPHQKDIHGWAHTETTEGWRNILSNTGLEDIRTKIERCEHIYASEDDWWSSVIGLDWQLVMDDLEEKGIITVEALKVIFFERLQKYKRSDGIRQTRDAVLACGRKP